MCWALLPISVATAVSSALHTKTGAWEISQGRRAWGAAKLDRTRLRYPWMRCRWGSPNLLPDASCQTASEIGSLQTITFSPWMLATNDTITVRDIWWPHPAAVKDLFYRSLVVRLDLTETRRRKEICQKVENFQPIKNGGKVELVTHPVFTAQTDQDLRDHHWRWRKSRFWFKLFCLCDTF